MTRSMTGGAGGDQGQRYNLGLRRRPTRPGGDARGVGADTRGGVGHGRQLRARQSTDGPGVGRKAAI